MSGIHLIAIETALFLATLAVFGWFADKAKVGGLQVYRGAADGIRMSRRTRRLWLIYVYGGYIILTGFTPTLVALALLQVGVSAASAEAANTAYLFAAMLVGAGSYRLTEATGELCYCWLPGYEEPDYLPLDRGGYEDRGDAWAFKLGMDLIRAEAGLIAETPAQIEREREALDHVRSRRTKANTEDSAARVQQRAGSLEDFASRALQRMREPEPKPVVEHRVIRRSA